MKDNSLFVEKTGQKICEMKRHYGLPTLKFIKMPADLLISLVQPRHLEKAIPWIWHLRLGHAGPKVIQRK